MIHCEWIIQWVHPFVRSVFRLKKKEKKPHFHFVLVSTVKKQNSVSEKRFLVLAWSLHLSILSTSYIKTVRHIFLGTFDLEAKHICWAPCNSQWLNWYYQETIGFRTLLLTSLVPEPAEFTCHAFILPLIQAESCTYQCMHNRSVAHTRVETAPYIMGDFNQSVSIKERPSSLAELPSLSRRRPFEVRQDK